MLMNMTPDLSSGSWAFWLRSMCTFHPAGPCAARGATSVAIRTTGKTRRNMEALLEQVFDKNVSNTKRRVSRRVVGRQPLLPPLHEQYYAGHNQTAYKRHEKEDPGHGKHADHEIDADIGCRIGSLADINDDRLLLQQAQKEHQLFKFCAPHVAASSASSTSVRTATPVAPLG